ncbi:MAG: SDR family NAD(P)-dependent oxidoreductase [Hellea sp.]|nr:SDR family NAD(P)-dependent oxidoreductase [Hellea sp.]
MTNKICFLTGATSGIGQAAALSLAQQNYDLHLVARNRSKAEATEDLIRKSVPDAKIKWHFGDLSRQADVRAIAASFLQTKLSIDLLFLNAGLCHNKRVLTKDGYELMLAVNHLAPFLLTQLLFDKLTEGSSETRVVITASGAYKAVKALNIDDMNWNRNFKTFSAYGNSKLSNMLFTQSLAKRLKQAAPKKTFTVNCYHPGFVGTGIGTQIRLGKVIMAMCRPFVRSSAKGAETGLYLATDPAVSGQSGGYYFNCEEQTLPAYARDADMAKALWDKSLAMTQLSKLMSDTSL